MTKMHELAIAGHSVWLDYIRRAGTTVIHTLNPAQQAEWRRALQPVYGQMENRIGKETVHAILREVAR